MKDKYWIAEGRYIMHHSHIDGRESRGVYCDAFTEERAKRILALLQGGK
jgi:hypothetical protein